LLFGTGNFPGHPLTQKKITTTKKWALAVAFLNRELPLTTTDTITKKNISKKRALAVALF
jgi:hypothetical protein